MTSRTIRLVTILVSLCLLNGCIALTSKAKQSEYLASRPVYVEPPPRQTGAIFQAGYEVSLFEDIRARRVGDILTVVLAERMRASKDAQTNTSKDSTVGLLNPTILGASPVFNIGRPFSSKLSGRSLETSIETSNSFAGKGDSSQSNSLTGNITVTVSEVLPNGNLVIRGEKRLTINQGDEFVQVYGIVRPSDINPDNTITSTKIADAKFSYIGEGSLASANTQGWLARFFNSKWWPL